LEDAIAADGRGAELRTRALVTVVVAVIAELDARLYESVATAGLAFLNAGAAVSAVVAPTHSQAARSALGTEHVKAWDDRQE